MEPVNDKSWISIGNRLDPQYIAGVDRFLDFSCANSKLTNQMIYCPCKNCKNVRLYTREEVRRHLIMKGIMTDYTTWTKHGEHRQWRVVDDSSSAGVGIEMLLEVFGMRSSDNVNEACESVGPNEDAKCFFDLLKKAEKPLYPNCTEFTAFSFIVEIFHLKCLNGWTNKSIDMLLEILNRVLQKYHLFPEKFYLTKKMISDLGLQ